VRAASPCARASAHNEDGKEREGADGEAGGDERNGFDVLHGVLHHEERGAEEEGGAGEREVGAQGRRPGAARCSGATQRQRR
jgi:hypothetical protein